NAVYHPSQPDLDTNEAKLATFSTIPLSELRLGMIDAGVTRWITISLGRVVLLSDLITSGTFTPTSIGRAPWQKLVASPSLQLNCNAEGFNAGPPPFAQARIGIVANEQNDCTSCDSVIGFGVDDSYGGGTTGNFASYSPENGPRSTHTFGYV